MKVHKYFPQDLSYLTEFLSYFETGVQDHCLFDYYSISQDVSNLAG